MLRVLIILLLASGYSIANSNDNQYYTDKYSQSVNGGIGLIEMPTARFSNDGEFGFGVSKDGPFNRVYAKMQFFPWMEAVLRYTEGKHVPYSEGSNQTWKDKGIDFKFRVLEENKNLPAIAIGLIDMGGTGAYSSEYIVANKTFNNIDFTMGLGWGRLDGNESLKNILWWRESTAVDTQLGGLIAFDQFFSGDTMSVFGGIEYFTKLPNLSLKVEYDSTNYTENIGRREKFNREGDIFELDSRINYAMNYRLKMSNRDNVDISLGFLRGNTIYANLAVHSNLNYIGPKKIFMGAERLRTSSLEPFSELNNEWQEYLTNTILWELANAGFVTHNIIFNDDELIAEISQGAYKETLSSLDLASRIVANNAPTNIDKITIVNIDQGLETLRSSINKNELYKSVLKGGLPEELLVFNNISSIAENAIIKNNDFLYPNFAWNIKPHLQGTIQHQQQFYFYQLEALLHAEYTIKKGLYLMADIGIDIDNNFDGYTYHVTDGELYDVRQDRRLYLTEGESGLRKMALDYLIDYSPNLKAKISAGYLEWMYGGIGGEILYMPQHKRWGLGIDAYWVKQRDFDQKFSFRDYETVTGFLTYYQDIPFYDMRFKLSMGKFLAKDVGAHIDISRRFKTGARVGGIVALTDCDANCVGEGSFNKWIYFELPLDLFYTKSSTRERTGYSWSPLTKNAGTKVYSGGLYGVMTNATNELETMRLKSWSLKKIFSGFKTSPKTGA